jgi:hypothetical protein
MEQEKIHFAYESKPVDEYTRLKIIALRVKYSELHEELERLARGSHDGRRLAHARTQLEDSAMWAIKSLTHI